jgi:hypothetical protein
MLLKKNIIFLVLSLLYSFSTLFAQQNEIIQEKTIFETTEEFNIRYFNVLYDQISKKNLLFVYEIKENDKNEYINSILIFDNKGNKHRIIEKISRDFYIHHKNTFTINNCFYFIWDSLYCLELNSFRIKSYHLRNSSYKSLSTFNDNGIDFILAGADKFIDVISLEHMEVLESIQRAEIITISNSSIIGKNKLIYLAEDNKLSRYNLQDNNQLWSFDTGNLNLKFLGIKLGIIDNIITDFNENGQTVYLSTISGEIYKIHSDQGTLLSVSKNFSGSKNNAGLIVSFIVGDDCNQDGIGDIIAPSVDHYIYCINGKDLTTIWKYDTGAENQTAVSLFDITKDGIADVFGINDEMKLSVINGHTGKLIYQKIIQKNIEGGKNQSNVIIADFFGESEPNIIVISDFNKLTVFSIAEIRTEKNIIIYRPQY